MRYATLWVLCAGVLALSGCTFAQSGARGSATASATVDATQAAKGDPSLANEGLPIEDLADKAKSSSQQDRTAIIETAHSATGIADLFYVWQLVKQGDTAVADVQGSKSAKRVLVALQRKSGEWTAVYQVRYLDASRDALLKAAPSTTDALAARVEFVVPVPVNEFYVRNRSLVTDFAADAEMPDGLMVMRAPTRLPEGFVMGTPVADQDGGGIRAEYSNGARRLTYFPLTIGDFAEDDSPSYTYTALRFGGLEASMDRSFHYPFSSTETGPYLSAASGFQALSGLGVSPGQIAAVAESMVSVTSGLPVPVTELGKKMPTDAEIAKFGDPGKFKRLWRGKDRTGTWWIVYQATDMLGDRYTMLAVRDSNGKWEATVPVQGEVQLSGSDLYAIPSEVVSAIQSAGISVNDQR
jgi:hypothetical protein